MAEIKQRFGTDVTSGITSQPLLDTGAADVFRSLAGFGDTVRRDVTDRLNRKMHHEGQIAGAKLGSRRDAEGKVIPIEELPYNPSTTYGSAAIRAAQSAYESNVRVDLSAEADRAVRENPDNPEAAMSVFSEYVDETQANVDPALRPFVETNAAGLLANIEAKTANEQLRRQRLDQATAIGTDIDQTAEHLGTLAYDGLGNTAEAASLLEYAETKLQTAVDSGLTIGGSVMTPARKREMMRDMRQGLLIQSAQGQIDRAIASGQWDVAFGMARASEERLVAQGMSRQDAQAASATLRSTAQQRIAAEMQQKNLEQTVAERPAQNLLERIERDPGAFSEEQILSAPEFSGQNHIREKALAIKRGQVKTAQERVHEQRTSLIETAIIDFNSGDAERELMARNMLLEEQRRSRNDHAKGRIDTAQYRTEQLRIMNALYDEPAMAIDAMKANPTADPETVASYLMKWQGTLPKSELAKLYSDYLGEYVSGDTNTIADILNGTLVAPTKKQQGAFEDTYGPEGVMEQTVFGPDEQLADTNTIRGARAAAEAPDYRSVSRDHLENAITLFEMQKRSGRWSDERLAEFWGGKGVLAMTMISDRFNNPSEEDVDSEGNPRVEKIMQEVQTAMGTPNRDVVRGLRSLGLDTDDEGNIIENERWSDLMDDFSRDVAFDFFEEWVYPSVKGGPAPGALLNNLIFSPETPVMTSEAQSDFTEQAQIYVREQARLGRGLEDQDFKKGFIERMSRRGYAVVEREGEQMLALNPPEEAMRSLLRRSGLGSFAEADAQDMNALVQTELVSQIQLRNSLLDGDVPVQDREFTMLRVGKRTDAYQVFWREENSEDRWQALEVPLTLTFNEEQALVPRFINEELKAPPVGLIPAALEFFGGSDAVLRPNKWYHENVTVPAKMNNVVDRMLRSSTEFRDALQFSNDVRAALGAPQIMLPADFEGMSLDEAAKKMVANEEKYRQWANVQFGATLTFLFKGTDVQEMNTNLQLLFGTAEEQAAELGATSGVAPSPDFVTETLDRIKPYLRFGGKDEENE